MNEKELRSFSRFEIVTKITYTDLSRNLQIDLFWSLYSFTIKLWKSGKMIKFKCKDHLQVFSWWMENNYEVFKIIKFWAGSHIRTLAKNLKIDQFWSFSSFTVKMWSQSNWSNSYVNLIYKCFLNELNRIKKF